MKRKAREEKPRHLTQTPDGKREEHAMICARRSTVRLRHKAVACVDTGYIYLCGTYEQRLITGAIKADDQRLERKVDGRTCLTVGCLRRKLRLC